MSDVLARQLRDMGYEVVFWKVSALIRAYAQYLKNPPKQSELQHLTGSQRYERYQFLGNSLRLERGCDFLAHLVVTHISLHRQKSHPGVDPRAITPEKVAYIVDQLKHPDECQLLRAVYRENFYLVGVLGNADSRKRRLRSEGIDSAEAEGLMERDRKQDENYGQKLEKTLQLADFFVRNSKSNSEELAAATIRFVKLIHGSIKVFPTRVEQGMYAAYSAARASACLSRQVGAAIHNRQGILIATGCNDVPKGGGGLYREGEGEDDRCAFLQGGVCFNHLEKDLIRNEFKLQISKKLKELSSEQKYASLSGSEDDIAQQLAQIARDETRLNDLIEFSRAVHAEMDALVSLARTGNGRAQDGVLFTTTYPCHNCARHIIAAGIRAVYFVEPYEKSLAVKLHHDAIDHDASVEEPLDNWDSLHASKRRVKFFHFEGVAPSKYLELFSAKGDRKIASTGKAIEFVMNEAKKKESLLLESYIEIEARLTEGLVNQGIQLVEL
ncbi:MAG: deoxycytidylate deaminase [Betaproteobacteria bacterium]|nr:deoxycytidylate deaminase [Betaproteobacteria bacterium]